MKRTITLILSLALIVCVCGCSSNKGDNNSSTSSDAIVDIEYDEVVVEDNNSTVTSNNESVSSQQGTTSNVDSSNQQAVSSNVTSSDKQPTSSDDNTEKVSSNSQTSSESVVIDYNKETEVDICDDIIRGYLSAKTTGDQYHWLNEYSGQSHDYQVLDLDWEYDGSPVYTITISENSDFSDGYSFEAGLAAIETTTFVPGKTYYWKATGTKSKDALGGGKLKIKDTPVRFIKIDGTGNVRDMGGWATESGKTVKYEMMYRGKALDDITDKGKETIKKLRLKTEIDIRADRNNPNPPQIGLNYKFISTETQYDLIFASDNSLREEVITNYKKIFELLSDKSNYPIYTHCSAGADRTGTFAFITNGLLGVSYEDLTRDFELTSFSSSGKRWRGNGDGGTFGPNDLEMKVDGNHIAWGKLYNKMMEVYGTGDGKLSSAIERFLISGVGVPKTQIDSFKSIMLG